MTRYGQRCPTCHQAAWTWASPPIQGMLLKPSLFVHAQSPVNVNAITCQACGELLSKDYFESGRWREDLVIEENTPDVHV